MTKLEIIASTVEDAKRVELGGGDRIELLVDLSKGGITPPIELVKEVRAAIKIPIVVMVKNTEGFLYDEETMSSHIEYINELKELNIEYIAFASLTSDGKINTEQLEQVIEAKGKMKLVYLRAFDEMVGDVVPDYELLENYDIDTLLTCGRSDNNAFKGKDNIKKLVDKNGKIKVAAGAGINLENGPIIAEYTNADFIHVGSAVRGEDGEIDTCLVGNLKYQLKLITDEK